MDRETVKQDLLDYGWDAAERQRVAELLRFVAEDAECHQAAADYDRIRAALHGADAETESEPPEGWEPCVRDLERGAPRSRGGPWLHVGGITAALLLATGLGWSLRPLGPRADMKPELVPASALALSPQEVRQNVSAFREVADVFDQRASWVLIGDRAADVGLGREAAALEDRLLLLRLALCRGAQVVSRSDLVIVPGQTARLTVPGEAGQWLQYTVSITTDAVPRLSLWLELQAAEGAGRTLAALATDLDLNPGQMLGAGEMVTSSAHYALKVAFAQANPDGRKS